MNPATEGHQSYWGSYPRNAASVVYAEIPGYVLSLTLFFVLPVIGAVCGLASVTFVGGLLGVALSAVAFLAARGFINDVRRLFGIRLVVQLDRRLRDRRGTYFSGETIVRVVKHLDATLPTALISAHIRRADDAEWFDPKDVHEVVSTLLEQLGSVETAPVDRDDIRRDLEVIQKDLKKAVDEGCRCRLVVVACLAMNGMLWEQLTAKGFG